MSSLGRVYLVAEMHGRDLIRRHIALGLLIVLPVSFYFTSAGNGKSAISSGGVSMAFAIGGATLFSTLSSMEVDQRLVLGGYRPTELLMGRLAFLGTLGICIATAFAYLMSGISHPAESSLVLLGVVLVAAVAVTFGLAVGSIVPRELEGTLVLIGVVGIQLAVRTNSMVSKFLPFYGPRRLLASALVGHGAVAGPLLQTALYATGLFLLARYCIAPRLEVRRHRHVLAD